MAIIMPQQFEILLPHAIAWAEEQESLILQKGIALTNSQLEDAKKIGVKKPEKIRLLRVEKIPTPTDPELCDIAIKTGLISPQTTGLTVRYGIFIRSDFWNHLPLIRHEFVHTMQYEHFGSFEGFLRPYLLECINPGYPYGPLEQEARRVQNET